MTNKSKELTGRKVLIIALSAFGVIFAANMTMLFAATGSFPGLVDKDGKNGFVASQGWNDRVAAQRALGWESAVGHADGMLRIRMTGEDGAPVDGLAVEARVGRPATEEGDRTMTLVQRDGAYTAPIALDSGLWLVAFQATDADGRSYRAKAELFVRDAD